MLEPGTAESFNAEGIRLYHVALDAPQMLSQYSPFRRTNPLLHVVNRGERRCVTTAFESAIAAYSEAIRLSPKVAKYYANRCQARLMQPGGDLRMAEADATSSLQFLQGNDMVARARYTMRRAKVLFGLHRFRDALRDVKEAQRCAARVPDLATPSHSALAAELQSLQNDIEHAAAPKRMQEVTQHRIQTQKESLLYSALHGHYTLRLENQECPLDFGANFPIPGMALQVCWKDPRSEPGKGEVYAHFKMLDVAQLALQLLEISPMDRCFLGGPLYLADSGSDDVFWTMMLFYRRTGKALPPRCELPFVCNLPSECAKVSEYVVQGVGDFPYWWLRLELLWGSSLEAYHRTGKPPCMFVCNNECTSAARCEFEHPEMMRRTALAVAYKQQCDPAREKRLAAEGKPMDSYLTPELQLGMCDLEKIFSKKDSSLALTIFNKIKAVPLCIPTAVKSVTNLMGGDKSYESSSIIVLKPRPCARCRMEVPESFLVPCPGCHNLFYCSHDCLTLHRAIHSLHCRSAGTTHFDEVWAVALSSDETIRPYAVLIPAFQSTYQMKVLQEHICNVGAIDCHTPLNRGEGEKTSGPFDIRLLGDSLPTNPVNLRASALLSAPPVGVGNPLRIATQGVAVLCRGNCVIVRRSIALAPNGKRFRVLDQSSPLQDLMLSEFEARWGGLLSRLADVSNLNESCKGTELVVPPLMDGQMATADLFKSPKASVSLSRREDRRTVSSASHQRKSGNKTPTSLKGKKFSFLFGTPLNVS